MRVNEGGVRFIEHVPCVERFRLYITRISGVDISALERYRGRGLHVKIETQGVERKAGRLCRAG